MKNVNGYCVPMEEALTPDQCKDMNHFLSMLVKHDGIAREYGKTLDLGVFMKEYRGVLRERAGYDMEPIAETAGQGSLF